MIEAPLSGPPATGGGSAGAAIAAPYAPARGPVNRRRIVRARGDRGRAGAPRVARGLLSGAAGAPRVAARAGLRARAGAFAARRGVRTGPDGGWRRRVLAYADME